jgi:galactose mutarotase-like enzyme
MVIIENKLLKVAIASKGAELQSIFHKSFFLEYMWNGDPVFWAKRSPVLFPIVGTLKDDRYNFKNKSYQLGRHGFAREMEFEVEDHQKDQVRFLLKSNEPTFKNFPFLFEFRVNYQLQDDELKTSYNIQNTGSEDLYFSVGGHPAFKLPLIEGTSYNDYYLEFDKNETLPRWPISPAGLLEKNPVPVLQHTRILPLTKELFFQDALVFKHPVSSSVSLKSGRTLHGLDFNFHGFPYLGIWAAKNADFVCIEPWCGIADNVDSDQQLIHKEGINELKKGEVFERSWRIKIF